jgi:hypothetical protein
MPLSHFKTLVDCQRANGVQLISGCNNGNTARKLITEIGATIREKLAAKLGSCCFSILTDGSQPRKTGQEKEMVMVRTVNDGVPVFYVVALVDMDSYGNANADNLKKAIDEVFLEKLGLPQATYEHHLIAATSDGASVNTGEYSGLLTQLKSSGRPWLVTIHCVSHRLELALKDCLMKDERFKTAKEFMVLLFYLFKKSGKIKRQFKELAKSLNVTVCSFAKAHGIRFINHVRKGLQKLLNNWPALMECLENAIATKDFKGPTHSKLQGILKKLKNFRLLSSCATFKALLDNVSLLSLSFENCDMQLFELPCLIQNVLETNTSLLDHDLKHFFANSNIQLAEDESVVTWQLAKKGDMRKSEENRVHVPVQKQSSDLLFFNVDSMSQEMGNALQKIVPSVNKCIEDRFKDTDNNLMKSMVWLDPANWGDAKEEVVMMQSLASQFIVPLQQQGFEVDALKREWPKLKNTEIFLWKCKKKPRICGQKY